MRRMIWLAVGLLSGGMLGPHATRLASGADDVPEAVLRAEQQRIAVIERAQRAAVSVFSTDGKGGGSGVVVTPDGYALTNFHVVQPCGNHMKCGMSDGQVYDAVLVGLDPTGDVALIKLLGRDDFPVA
jgi:serine protease Do